MKKFLVVVALLACYVNSFAASLDKIRIDVNDPNVPNGVAKTFDASKLSVRQVKERVGKTTKNQAISISCFGDKMGWHGSGYSAFDLIGFYDNGEINLQLRKLGVSLDMKLTDVCWRNQIEFDRTHP